MDLLNKPLSNARQSLPRKKLSRKKTEKIFANEQYKSARILLNEEAGYIEADDGEDTWNIKQDDIKSHVDIVAATKSFDLKLHEYGPYRLDYLRNGRYLLIGGQMGHVACIDWVTKKLICEMNVQESIHDVSWLHQDVMFAVAQKKWVHIYDKQGVEIHCIKQLHRVLNLEFLPYHFLLAASSDLGYLSWLDVSIGKLITSTNTHMGKLNVMSQNPSNAVIMLGTSKGSVTMWSPCVKNALATMFCHSAPLTDVTVDASGTYLATTAADRSFKIWDLRNYKCLKFCRIPQNATKAKFSQRGLLALSVNDCVQMYRDCCTRSEISPYMSYRVGHQISDFAFCPFEDVLGIGHQAGFSSILVPGAGEPNFDTLEINVFQNKSQRQEAEVKALLEKIQPEMITLDPMSINKVWMEGEPIDKIEVGNNSDKKTSKGLKHKAIEHEEGRQKRVRETYEKSVEFEEKVEEEDHQITKPNVLSRFRPKSAK
ncbi:hypothetical protein CHUAL_006102 [Chamberlinius hualienensis]